MIQELCLVPSNIIKKILSSDIHVLNKKTLQKDENINSNNNDNSNLIISEIKTQFKKSPIKEKKALDLYTWLILNVKNIEI